MTLSDIVYQNFLGEIEKIALSDEQKTRGIGAGAAGAAIVGAACGP